MAKQKRRNILVGERPGNSTLDVMKNVSKKKKNLYIMLKIVHDLFYAAYPICVYACQEKRID